MEVVREWIDEVALLTDPGPFQVLISDPGPVQEPVGSGWDAFWEGAFAGALAALIGGQLRPQIALPEEIGTVPIGVIVGGVMAL